MTLTDLPHVLPLATVNVRANWERHGLAEAGRPLPETSVHVWGDSASAATLPHADLITAADVLYNRQYYGALLKSLVALSQPHTLIYIAWKRRHKDEEAFPELAAAQGFVVERVPVELLVEEYRDGTFVVLRLCTLDPMRTD